MKTVTSLLTISLMCACAEAQSPPSGKSSQGGASAPRAAPTPAPSAAPAAAVRMEPPRIDFGFVQPHTLLEAEAKIVNDTDQPLRILAAQPTCQCTTVDLVGKVIPARGALPFPVSMKVSSTGEKHAAVQVVVEGFDSVLRIDLVAEVVYSIRAATQNVPGGSWDPYIDAATNPLRVRGEVTISSLDGKPFRVLSVGMKPPQFLDWDPATPPKSSYRAKYDVSARDCDSMPRYLIIETDREDAPLIDMRVRHQCTHIKPKIQIAEFRANAGVISPSKPGLFELEIKKVATSAGRLEITGVVSTHAGMTAEIVDRKFDGESLLVTVRLTPKAGTQGVFLFPVRFGVQVPGQPASTEELLVYTKAIAE